MDGNLHKIKSLARMTVLVLALAGIVAPAAFGVYSPQDGWSPGDLRVAQPSIADGRSPDTLDAAYFVQSSISDGRSPDTLDAAQIAQSVPLDGRSADTLDAVQSNSNVVPIDGRSADTIDAAQTSHSLVVRVSETTFNWGDAGVGAGFGAGLILLLVGAGLILRRYRREEFGFSGKPAMHQP